MDLTKLLPGKKTYLAAAGLVVMAALQFKAGDLVGASQSVLAALAAFGLRSALASAPQPPAPPAPAEAPASAAKS